MSQRSTSTAIVVALILLIAFTGCSPREYTGRIGDDGRTQATPNPGATSPAATQPATAQTGVYATVTRVIDGDTVDVVLEDGRRHRVRYIGIDTPERYEDLYGEATDANARLVDRKKVLLVKDVSETDKYGRLLRYVYAGDTFVNAELVKRGYAAPATFPPDVKYAEHFVKLAAEARSKGAGLWAPSGQRDLPPANGGGTVNNEDGYIGNKNSGKFHTLDCSTLPAPHNRIHFDGRQEAISAGYVPCKNCDP